MWKRLKRAVSSNLERLRDDPLSPRDWRALSKDLATVRSQADLLEQDLARLSAEEEALSDSIREALREGRRSEGLDLADSLSRVRRDKTKVTEQLAAARRVVAKAEALESIQQEASERRASRTPASRVGAKAARSQRAKAGPWCTPTQARRRPRGAGRSLRGLGSSWTGASSARCPGSSCASPGESWPS